MPMERWFVSASSIELSAGVDKKMGMGSTGLEDLQPFCIAEGTLVCAKCLDDAERVALRITLRCKRGLMVRNLERIRWKWSA